MGRRLAILAMAAALALGAAGGAAAAEPPRLLVATRLGTDGNDDLQGVAIAPDDTIWVAGNTASPVAEAGGLAPATFGRPVDAARCGCGFVAHLAADGKRVLAWAQLARGIAILTTVQTSPAGVYVAGYASEGLEPVLEGRGGLVAAYPLKGNLKAARADPAAWARDKINGRPGLGRLGAPCVLRLSADLQKIESGTYLEGWQQVWSLMRFPPLESRTYGDEFDWQPTHLAVLAGGDLLVCHDGGYVRDLTDDDRRAAGPGGKPNDRLTFYDVADHLSRLAPDLASRRWTRPIYAPPTDPATAARFKGPWDKPHYGNPRTLRLRPAGEEAAYLCGWSASSTSREPWWSPYLWKIDMRTGEVVWRAYDFDPMSGGDNRLGGLVSDAGVRSVAADGASNVLIATLGDGGNTVLRQDPRDYTKPVSGLKGGVSGFKGAVHHWGTLARLNGETREFLGGAHVSGRADGRVGPAWAIDLAPLDGGRVLAVGRYDSRLDFTPDAWFPGEGTGMFLRVYSPAFDLEFSTPVPGVVPFEVARQGARRAVVVGQAKLASAPTRSALVEKPLGGYDGYLMIVEFP